MTEICPMPSHRRQPLTTTWSTISRGPCHIGLIVSILLHTALLSWTLIVSHRQLPAEAPVMVDLAEYPLAMVDAMPARSQPMARSVPANSGPEPVPSTVAPTATNPMITAVDRPFRLEKKAQPEVKPSRVTEKNKSRRKPHPANPGPAPPQVVTEKLQMTKTNKQVSSDRSTRSTHTPPPQDDPNTAGKLSSEFVRNNFAHIRALIVANLTFPAIARKMGWTGRIVVMFTLTMEGEAEDIVIVSGSEHEVLNQNVIAAIRRTAPFPKPPTRAKLVLPISYTLK